MIFFDTETFGFVGPMILLQYAINDEEPILWDCWLEDVEDTLHILEAFGDEDVVGFNLTFDWYQMNKLYTMFKLFNERYGNKRPIGYVDEIAQLEADARFGPCLKPKSALDLMLHARKGAFQTTMDRKALYLRKVPTIMVQDVIAELESRLNLGDIYFTKKNKFSQRIIDNTFSDIKLSFSPSTSLKSLVVACGIREKRELYSELSAPAPPMETSWAPYATAISSWPTWAVRKKNSGKSGYTWPALAEKFFAYWYYTDKPRQYALDDVLDTRNLYKHFGCPPTGDDDSTLACMMGSIRWRGYKINSEGIQKKIEQITPLTKEVPVGQDGAYRWLEQVMTPIELEMLRDAQGKRSTAKLVLEAISSLKKNCSCVKTEMVVVEKPGGFGGTIKSFERKESFDPACTCTEGKIEHPAAERAKKILSARQSKIKIAMLKKLLQAGRFHATGSPIGSLSGRMSGRTTGGDGQRVKGLNALGIDRDKETRSFFEFADESWDLNGGDFEAYEISIAEAAYNDPELRKQLLSCNVCGKQYTPDQFRTHDSCPNCGCSYTSCKSCKGQITVKGSEIVESCRCGKNVLKELENTTRKIHALFAMELFPGKTYNDIVASKGTSNDMYDKGKRCIFGGLLYGGDEGTMERRVGIPIEIGKKGRDKFFQRFKGIQEEQKRCFEAFCSMRQEGGLGTKVTYMPPEEYAESLLGFRRYFTIENQLSKMLFDLSNVMPEKLVRYKSTVIRRDREQTMSGACRSSLLAAAFNLQSQVMRAALNHKIQSTGAEGTKRLQRRIWNHQPHGVHEFVVLPMNIHDEIMCPSKIDLTPTVDDFVTEMKEVIPLICIKWKTKLKDWSQK